MLYISISSINLGSYSKTRMLSWEDFSHMFDGFFSFNENFWCFMKNYSLMFKSSKKVCANLYPVGKWDFHSILFYIPLIDRKVQCISKKSKLFNNLNIYVIELYVSKLVYWFRNSNKYAWIVCAFWTNRIKVFMPCFIYFKFFQL